MSFSLWHHSSEVIDTLMLDHVRGALNVHTPAANAVDCSLDWLQYARKGQSVTMLKG